MGRPLMGSSISPRELFPPKDLSPIAIFRLADCNWSLLYPIYLRDLDSTTWFE